MDSKEKLGNYTDGSRPTQLSNAIYWEEVTPDMKLTAREGSWFADDRLVYWTGQTAAEAKAKMGSLYQKQKERMKKPEPDLELKALDQFSGTQEYHKVLGFNVTDGVNYIMENGYAYLVTDLLAVCLVGVKGTALKRIVQSGSFLVITYKVDLEKKTGIFEIREDSDRPIVYSQKYGYTNAKVQEIKLFLIDRVLMLAGEY